MGGGLASLPSFAKYQIGGEESASGDPVCEECGESSPRVALYTLPTVILTHHLMRLDQVAKCPRCLRHHIVTRLPLAVLLAHLYCPLVIASWAWAFVRSFRQQKSAQETKYEIPS
jgi:hypothetical protein